MATTKVKRPTKTPLKKIKAGKKKPLNKWLILGGVATVAIIGAVVVRFSSASTWHSVKYVPMNNYRFTYGQLSILTPPVTLKQGRSYRVCMRGFSEGRPSSIQLSFFVQKPTYRDRAALSTKSYGVGSELHCSKVFKATKNHQVSGRVGLASGSALRVQAISIDELR